MRMWPPHREPPATGHAATESSRGDLAAAVTRPGLLRPSNAAETDHGRTQLWPSAPHTPVGRFLGAEAA